MSGGYDFVGVADDEPRKDRLPTDRGRRFIRKAARGERSLRRGQARRNIGRFRGRKDRPEILRIHVEIIRHAPQGAVKRTRTALQSARRQSLAGAILRVEITY